MTFIVVAHYRARPDADEKVSRSLREMVDPSRAEPGNLTYRVGRSVTNPNEFIIYEEYVDEAAFQTHLASAHFERFLKVGTLPNLEYRKRYDLTAL